jgi:hypothetical protein
VKIQITRIGVNTKVMKLGLRSDGTLDVPPFDHADEVGWYEKSPDPGAEGPAVIVGHIDSPQGPAVFYRLASLIPGDLIQITRADGSVAIFRVSRLESPAKNRFPTHAVYGNINYAGLRLITCGGSYDPSAGGYQSNTIVFAKLIKIARNSKMR